MKPLRPNQPHLITIVGLPGSGKTFFASKFAETFNAPYVSTEEIMHITSCDEKSAKEMSIRELGQLLKTRQSILLEGGTDSRTDRLALAKQAREAGYRMLLVWVQTDSVTAKNRAIRPGKNKTNRTLTSEEYDRIAKHFTAPNVSEQPVVISGKHTYATQVKIILKKLSSDHEHAAGRPAIPERRVVRRIGIQ